MKRLWVAIGIVTFWCSWPVLWFYLHGSKRTRLLLICGNEFLVVRSWLGTGHWTLPGGGLHADEAAVHAVMREVQEETGLTFLENDIRLLCVGAESRQFGFRYSYDCFVATMSERPDIQLQKSEVIDFAWQPLAHPSLQLNQDALDTLKCWQNQASPARQEVL